MPNYLFSSLVQNLVSDSVKRARIKSEQTRQIYATELIDTYSGFSKKYIDDIISKKTTNEAVKKALIEMIICYPLLQTFIDEISMVYACQPKREFYVDGKLLIDAIPKGTDSVDYKEDKTLFEQINNIYGKRLQMQLKKAEIMTNLLQTTVYKVNNRNNEIKIDFVPNDICVVAALKDDVTAMGAIRFLRNVSTIDQVVTPIYEQWDAMTYQITDGKNVTTDVNRAADLAEKYWGSRLIESGVAPFAVFRTELPDDDFWNIKDQDLVETIKQINLALTEMRYLIRYASFGLKYIANLDIVGEKTLDPLGIWQLNSTNKVPGQNQKDWEVGELENKGRITDIVESVKFLITLLFQFYGININSLVGSGNVQSADSKAMDKESVIRYIRYQKDIWQLNEEILLKNIICVYNRDHVTQQLPETLTIKLCFPEEEMMADELIKRAELWMIKIQNNVATALDWIRSENYGISEEEAKVIFQKNEQINQPMPSQAPAATTNPNETNMNPNMKPNMNQNMKQ